MEDVLTAGSEEKIQGVADRRRSEPVAHTGRHALSRTRIEP